MYYLSSICFVCLRNKSKLSAVFDRETQEVIYALPELTILKPEKPAYICSSCHTTLRSFSTFKKKCLDNYSRLNDYIKALKGSNDTPDQSYSELQIRVINYNEQLIKHENDIHSNIKEDALMSLEEQHNQKIELDDIKEESLAFEDSAHRDFYQQLVKSESVSDGVQNDGSSVLSKENNALDKENYHTTVIEDYIVVQDKLVVQEVFVLKLNNQNENEDARPSEEQDDFNNTIENNIDIKDELLASECSAGRKHDQQLVWTRSESVSDDEQDSGSSNTSENNNAMYKDETNSNINTNSQEFQCSMCKEVFTNKLTFDTHLRNHISNIVGLECLICNKKMRRTIHLKQHMKSHLDYFQSNDEKAEGITTNCYEQEKYYDVSNIFSDDSIADPDVLPIDEFESSESEQGETQKKLYIADFGNAELHESSNCREESKKNFSIEMNCIQTQTVLKGKSKQDFCVFCKKLITKIYRHLETVHKNEPEVKEFACLPKGNDERKQLIAILRKKGNFFFNTNEDFNNKQIITCRRTQKGKERNPDHYLPCPNCKGFFSKLTLRRHVRICDMEEKGEQNILMRSRRIRGCIHKKACEILKNEVFPILRDDEVTKVVRYDELAIVYANKLCSKYRSKHHFPVIRSKLRLIGRFLIEIRQLNPLVTDFSSVFDPKYFESVVKAINQVAKLDGLTGRYGSPTTAFMFGTLLKKCANILLLQCIMQENTIKKRMTKDFLKLLHQDFTYSINSTVKEQMRKGSYIT